MSQPLRLLEGVRILAFTQWLFGPAAVQYLADMGAEVTKVEPPGEGSWERRWAGGQTFINGESACFLLTHRNARSVAINLKDETSRRAIERLVGASDVVVQNYRPGVMERLGLGYERLREIKPDLIYASASGYGSDGPGRDLPGQDLLAQALSGLIWATGQEGQIPRPAGAAVVDQHAGLLLATGILGALFHRERTGDGQCVDVNMVEAALDLQLEPAVYHLNDGNVARPRTGIGSSFHEAPYGVYPVEDGFIAISLTALATVHAVLGSPPALATLLEDPEAHIRRRDEVYEAIVTALPAGNRHEVVAELRAGGVWCAPVLSYDEVFADPIVEHLDLVMDIEHPTAGTVRLLRPPIRFSGGETDLRRPPPAVGEHTEEMLRAAGVAGDDIVAILG